MRNLHAMRLTANGADFACFAAGDGPLVLCLHGFPDSAHTFADLLPRLADAGYRAVAPFMRGYAPTRVGSDARFDAPTLGRDALALADTLGVSRFAIVGHDWGAVAGYAAAALAPDRISSLVTAAVPPPRCFLGGLSPRQLRRSWYMGFFQVPYVPERRLDGGFIARLWRAWSPSWRFSPQALADAQRSMHGAANRRAVLAYYRALPAALLSPRAHADRKRTLGPLRVPGLVIAGEEDGCIGTEVFGGVERAFAGPAEHRVLPGGHFMHREHPERFADEVLGFLPGPPPNG